MTTRRTFLTVAGMLPSGIAMRARAAASTSAPGPAATPIAAAPISKAQVGYQDIPSGGKVCAQCVYFIFVAVSGATPASRCKLVAGPINPAGWCEIWAPRG